MLYDYPTIIVDNFLKYPYDVREFALKFKFTSSSNGTYSGKRTESIHHTHPNFFQSLSNKILNCYSIQYVSYNATSYFHLTGEEFGDSGWVHTDAYGNQPPGVASIIYLNPQNNSIDNGTTHYKLDNLDHGNELVRDMKESFIEVKDKKDLRYKNNQDYMPTTKIGNIFNRMIAYDTRTPHAGASYFGNDITSSRLTLLTFFHNIQIDNNYTPLRHADACSEI